MIIALNLSLHNQEMERKVETAKLKKERNCRATPQAWVQALCGVRAAALSPSGCDQDVNHDTSDDPDFHDFTARKRAAHVLSWSVTKKAHVLSFSS